jgi:hypothetical protein
MLAGFSSGRAANIWTSVPQIGMSEGLEDFWVHAEISFSRRWSILTGI